jgi:hypothetical protein
MIEATGLGLLTPEETLKRATHLNNSFQLLWRNANAKQKKELDPIMAGWVAYFNKLRTSWVARTTEYGELAGWEKEYQKYWNKFQAEGTKITAPVIVAGKPPGTVAVDIPKEDIEESLKRAGTWVIALGTLGALGVGWLLWRMRRA